MKEKIKRVIRRNKLLISILKPLLSVSRNIILEIRIKKKKIFAIIDKEKDKEKLMINWGGGHYFRRHWKVLDFYSESYKDLKEELDYEFDLTSSKPFPLKSNSVSFFYSSHVLEHISQKYCQNIFKEIYRCLKKEGAVRLTMPDFDKAHQAFAKNKRKFLGSNKGKKITEKFLCFFACPLRGNIDYQKFKKDFSSFSKEVFANKYIKKIPLNLNYPHLHVNWWNYKKLSQMLKKAGFKKVYQSFPQKSKFIEMRGRGRYCGFDSLYPSHSFFIEAVK